jgi:hypothetical protein
MQFSAITLFALSGLFATSMAKPAYRRQTNVCASGTPNCCDVDVLGIADLDCEVRMLNILPFLGSIYFEQGS